MGMRTFLGYACVSAVLASHPFVPQLTAQAAAISSIRIDNFGQIDTSYYRGAQPAGRDYADLAALGVKTVIDLQADGRSDEQRLVTAAGMTFHRIPMTTHVEPTEAQLTQFLEIVANPANQPVYVHCAGGRHRTGVMTAVYRMEKDRWTAAQAFSEMKKFKFGMDFLHPEFKRFVYGYRSAGMLTSGQPPVDLAAVR